MRTSTWQWSTLAELVSDRHTVLVKLWPRQSLVPTGFFAHQTCSNTHFCRGQILPFIDFLPRKPHSTITTTARSAILNTMASTKLGSTQLVVLVTFNWDNLMTVTWRIIPVTCKCLIYNYGGFHSYLLKISHNNMGPFQNSLAFNFLHSFLTNHGGMTSS